jgi:hypothetical protein
VSPLRRRCRHFHRPDDLGGGARTDAATRNPYRGWCVLGVDELLAEFATGPFCGWSC